MSEPELRRFDSWPALAEAATDRLAEAVDAGLRERGASGLALAGGSTPPDIYRGLSARPLDWSRVSIVSTDERWAAADSPDSNARLLRETLLQGEAAQARLIPLKDEGASTPEAAAEMAETALERVPWPLDAVLLGMGADGHFASLFQGSSVLPEGLDLRGHRRVLAVGAGDPAPAQPRLSLTLSALLDTRVLMLVVRGADKLDVLKHAGGAAFPVTALLTQDRVPLSVFWSP